MSSLFVDCRRGPNPSSSSCFEKSPPQRNPRVEAISSIVHPSFPLKTAMRIQQYQWTFTATGNSLENYSKGVGHCGRRRGSATGSFAGGAALRTTKMIKTASTTSLMIEDQYHGSPEQSACNYSRLTASQSRIQTLNLTGNFSTSG